MLNQLQAQIQLEIAFPEVKVKAWTTYQDYFLFRVEHSDPWEKDWDPFFSVDKLTGEARDFSVITDIKPLEFVALTWNDI